MKREIYTKKAAIRLLAVNIFAINYERNCDFDNHDGSG